MAKNKLSAPILREIDRQRIVQYLFTSHDFGTFFPIHFQNERDLEEEERKWKECIQRLKEILAEYQNVNGEMPTHPSRV